MSVQSIIRAGLSKLGDLAPNAEIAVVIDGTSGTGLLDTSIAETAPDEFGEMGITTGAVRVSAGTFTLPEKGAAILVNGEKVIVTQVRTDPVGAVYVVEYQDRREVGE